MRKNESKMNFSNNQSLMNNSSVALDLTISPFLYTFFIVLFLIFMLSLLLNSISIASIVSTRAFTPINLLIMNLAIADLTYTLGIPMFISTNFSQNWLFGLSGCRFFMFTEFFGIVVGVFAVTALSVERLNN